MTNLEPLVPPSLLHGESSPHAPFTSNQRAASPLPSSFELQEHPEPSPTNVGAPHHWNTVASLSHLATDDPFLVSLVPHDPARHLPRTSPVLAGKTLPPASRQGVIAERATTPSSAQTVRGDHAMSAPGARAPSPRRGPLPRLEWAARPRPTWLFGRPRVAGRCVARAVTRAGSRPSTVRGLKNMFSKLVK
jgi:hypothetical protein